MGYHAGVDRGGGADEVLACMWGRSMAKEGGYADGAGVPACLQPRFGGCEGGWSALLAAAAVRVRASAFCAAVCASGRASRPELSPPLYGSVILTRGFLRLRPPMRSVAGGSGEDVVAGRLLWCRFAPIRSVVSDQVP